MMGIAAKTASTRGRSHRVIKAFRNDESGATTVEYGLILALMFLAIIGAVKNFGSSTNAMYDKIETTMSDAIE